ncbi:hypothetical protein HMPREF2137_04450 [Hoylesella buccalis DNF00853]|uniref:Uncharacterized protein n=1 Tax=Hoylesella buccalis DNF00853 TaxID=1401074 RepID=A0A095ZLJ9_9BACT|nr:hypothetical protein HMPREF2137_04450 [Hoylesella buccalis DNF00853]
MITTRWRNLFKLISMSKKLHTLLTLVVQNLLGYKIIVMHNLMTKFQKILENSKQYAGNQVNEKRKVPQFEALFMS